VKDGLPEKTNPSIRRGWKATDLLGDGKPPIKNFGVVFCEKRPHFFLPPTVSCVIKESKIRKAGGRTSSWVFEP
jgi:hypothetical protein